jgi:MbtH protein
VTHRFDDESTRYLVLVNAEGQHSLWPACLSVPYGWTVAHDEDNRLACLDYVKEHWTDMRPQSLIRAMAEAVAAWKSSGAPEPGHEPVPSAVST